MMRSIQYILCGSLVALGGCADSGAEIGRTAKGVLVEINRGQLASRDLVSLCENTRIVADVENDRFIIASSDIERPYLLGRRISCDAASPIRVGTTIGCWAPDNRPAQGSPVVEYVYVPLAHALYATDDASLLEAPVVMFAPIASHGLLACGIPTEDFQRVMGRFATDIKAEIASNGNTPVRALASYQGLHAVTYVPAGLMGPPVPTTAQQSRIIESNNDGDPGTVAGGESGPTCTCNTQGICTKQSKLVATWCDATNCQSCTLSL